MLRLVLILLVSLALAGSAGAKMPSPDATWTTRISGVKFLCARWGAAPKQFVIACIPQKKTLPPGAS